MGPARGVPQSRRSQKDTCFRRDRGRSGVEFSRGVHLPRAPATFTPDVHARRSYAILLRVNPTAVLRLLHLEDDEDDHALTLAQLRRDGLQVQALRVDTLAAFEQALASPWDAVISDWNLPGFTGLDALARFQEAGQVVPFILVSGAIGEETAAQAMRSGASDYLLKHNLTRLAPALSRALEAAQARRDRQQADLELAQSRQRLQELTRHLQSGIEAERAAIAREIHDEVGGSLTALRFDLAWIERRTADPALLQRVRAAQDALGHAMETSRRIMHNLRPAILEQGLAEALQWLAGRFERRTGIATVFRSSHESLPALPAGVALVAYRTAQEALTNVSKHAQARRVSVDLALAHEVLSLEVADDGCGIAEGALAKARSFGIRGLHERAATVGGWIDLSSGGRGTSLILSVPLAQAADRPPVAEPQGAALHDPSAWS